MSHHSIFAISEDRPTADTFAPDEDTVFDRLHQFDSVELIKKDLENIKSNLTDCLGQYENVAYSFEKGSDGAPDSVMVTVGKGSIRKVLERTLERWKSLCASATDMDFAFLCGPVNAADNIISRSIGRAYVVDTTDDYEIYDPLQEWLFNRVKDNDENDTVFFVYEEYDAHY